MDSPALQRTFLNVIILNLALGIIILGSLRYNARLWLQDYAKPIRDKVPPISPAEKHQRAVVIVLVMAVLLGGLILESLQLRADRAAATSFGVAYLHIFLLLAIFNLFDALVLDQVILTLLTPKFVILPGAEGMEDLFRDYRKQLTDFLKGFGFCAFASLPFAFIVIVKDGELLKLVRNSLLILPQSSVLHSLRLRLMTCGPY